MSSSGQDGRAIYIGFGPFFAAFPGFCPPPTLPRYNETGSQGAAHVNATCAHSRRIAYPRDGRNKEMRSALCLLVVCLFGTTATAQFGNVGSTTRTTTPPADATPKKATNEKTHAGKVAAKNEPAADSDLADAL